MTLKRVVRVTLEWRALAYTVPVGPRRGCRQPQGTKTILQDLSATVPPGRLVAILGPSGCGKVRALGIAAGPFPYCELASWMGVPFSSHVVWQRGQIPCAEPLERLFHFMVLMAPAPLRTLRCAIFAPQTSLVNALAGRLPVGGTLEGAILVNGLERGRGFRTITGYVMQVRRAAHAAPAALPCAVIGGVV